MHNSVRIIAIPGLGGSKSVYEGYAALLPGFEFETIELIDIEAAERELAAKLQDGKETLLLANCYGAQLALSMRRFNTVVGIIIIEPFLSEAIWWRIPALWITDVFLALCRLVSFLGIRRSYFKQNLDYRYLSRYPLFVQPVFDLLHQPVDAYLLKIKDLLTYRYPQHITTPTLLVLSPGGYVRGARKRRRITGYFTDVHVIDTTMKSHNIVTLSEREITGALTSWYAA